MRRLADRFGPESIAFSQASPSTTAIGDSGGFVRRLMHAFGTPNLVRHSTCAAGDAPLPRAMRSASAAWAPAVAAGPCRISRDSGCLILWGYNPSMSRLTHATATVEALKRGMKLIVVDPRNAGLANKADVWLRVRPGRTGRWLSAWPT